MTHHGCSDVHLPAAPFYYASQIIEGESASKLNQSDGVEGQYAALHPHACVDPSATATTQRPGSTTQRAHRAAESGRAGLTGR